MIRLRFRSEQSGYDKYYLYDCVHLIIVLEHDIDKPWSWLSEGCITLSTSNQPFANLDYVSKLQQLLSFYPMRKYSGVNREWSREGLFSQVFTGKDSQYCYPPKFKLRRNSVGLCFVKSLKYRIIL